jgi:hypothetical protein
MLATVATQTARNSNLGGNDCENPEKHEIKKMSNRKIYLMSISFVFYSGKDIYLK